MGTIIAMKAPSTPTEVRYSKIHAKAQQRAGKKLVYYPEIRLSGKWLAELGFAIGDPISFSFVENFILIMRADSSNLND